MMFAATSHKRGCFFRDPSVWILSTRKKEKRPAGWTGLPGQVAGDAADRLQTDQTVQGRRAGWAGTSSWMGRDGPPRDVELIHIKPEKRKKYERTPRHGAKFVLKLKILLRKPQNPRIFHDFFQQRSGEFNLFGDFSSDMDEFRGAGVSQTAAVAWFARKKTDQAARIRPRGSPGLAV